MATNDMAMGPVKSKFMENSGVSELEKEEIIRYIDELKYAELRDNALLELSRQREHFSELAPYIWHSVGTIAALLQEIVAVYPLLSPPVLDNKTSNKACNVLALLQCVASHKDTRQLFLKAHIPLFLYPFLNTCVSPHWALSVLWLRWMTLMSSIFSFRQKSSHFVSVSWNGVLTSLRL
jgi:CCR4-NOT transcription complex subunit 9